MVDIEIKAMVESDLDFFSQVRNSCSEEFLHDSRKFTLDQVLIWFNEKKPDFYIITKGGEKIGYFRTSNLNEEERTIFIGCDLHENFRNKGIGYQAYLIFIPFISQRYSLGKIYLEVLSTNIPAISLYKKLGFLEDSIKEKSVLKGKDLVDSILMYLEIK